MSTQHISHSKPFSPVNNFDIVALCHTKHMILYLKSYQNINKILISKLSCFPYPGCWERRQNMNRITTKPNYFMSEPSLVSVLTAALIGCWIQAVFFKFSLKICLAFSTENFTLDLRTQNVSISSLMCFFLYHTFRKRKSKKNTFLQ